MSNWQPIETAPKDGSEVLAYFPDLGRQIVVRWNSPSPSQYKPHWNAGRLMMFDPSDWMPLPEPPK